MRAIKFQVDGYLESGSPVEEEDVETIIELEYYEELIKLIEDGNDSKAINLVNQNLDAEFIIENIAPFEDEGFEFLDVKNVSAKSPYIEEIDGVFTYLVATKDQLGMAKDTMAAKPLVLYESDSLIAMASEEVAIRAILPQEIDTYDPYDEEVRVWQA